jgi:hypothetical protein
MLLRFRVADGATDVAAGILYMQFHGILTEAPFLTWLGLHPQPLALIRMPLPSSTWEDEHNVIDPNFLCTLVRVSCMHSHQLKMLP